MIPFQVEHKNYEKAIISTGIIFYGLAIIVSGVIFLYFILRFGCKKCIGPQGLKQITRNYRNISWFLFSKFFFSKISHFIFWNYSFLSLHDYL